MKEVRLTLGWVAQAAGGSLTSGRADREIGSVVTDSRTLQAGDLFVALRGPRFDGHEFVTEVLQRGAAGAIVFVSSGMWIEPSPPTHVYTFPPFFSS